MVEWMFALVAVLVTVKQGQFVDRLGGDDRQGRRHVDLAHDDVKLLVAVKCGLTRS